MTSPAAEPTLSEAVGDAVRVVFVGLAKNTGKTEALASLVAELDARGRPLALTSIGRDGEKHDAIEPRIGKPPVPCPRGSLVATAEPLLARCEAPRRTLLRTGVRTPLGEVVVARLGAAAEVELAGPSNAADLRAVVDAMLELGARQAIVDGSIDRRAAAAPELADAVVIATGAVLGRDLAAVVRRTRFGVELADLPVSADPRLPGLGGGPGRNFHLPDGGRPEALPPRFAFEAGEEELERLLGDDGGTLRIGGALPECLLEALLPVAARAPVKVVANDATRVFLADRAPGWYRRRGIALEVLRGLALRAITVNPVAPLSHRLDSAELRAAVAPLRPGLPVLDVRSPAYRAAAA